MSRRPMFQSGSCGGGLQPERASGSSKVGFRATASRPSLASRDNSQPSSREPSESRKFSHVEERSSVCFVSVMLVFMVVS